MSGTKQGGLKAAKSNMDRHGADFYKRIGAIGGSVRGTKGFALRQPCHCDVLEGEHTLANCRGKIGGAVSRRGPSKK